jgi:transketolase
MQSRRLEEEKRSIMDSEMLAYRIRMHGLEMTHVSKGSHIAAVLSVADIVAVLYADIARVGPGMLRDPNRDRVILSKGHAGAAIYSALAETGFMDPAVLLTHYADGSTLSGHVSHKGVPGVEFSTGSLGHGLAVGAGMALAGKIDARDYRVFVILGDGECDEGSVWEAAMFSAHHGLRNLAAVVDYNKMQSLKTCEETIRLEPFADKWRSFGWEVREADGHDHSALKAALAGNDTEKPLCVLAHTVKGKGVSFMENNILWHYRSPQGEEYLAARRELESRYLGSRHITE